MDEQANADEDLSAVAELAALKIRYRSLEAELENARAAPRRGLPAGRAAEGHPDRFHALIDAIDDGIAVIEFIDGPRGPFDDYLHVEANRAFARHSGLADVVGLTVREVVPDEADGWIAIYRRVLETGEATRFRKSLGATHHLLELSAFRMEPAGLRRIAVLFKDVSAQERAEQDLKQTTAQLDALLRSSNEVRYRINADWSELAQLQGGGFIPDTESTNSNWLADYIPEEHRVVVRAEIRRSLEAKDVYNVEHLVNRVDGTVGWALSRAVPLFDENGEITSWMGAASDITYRKRSEENQQVLNQELGHRIKNMLTIVQAIATRTLGQAHSLDQARSVLSERLAALARAQDLLTEANFSAADVRDVVRAAIRSHPATDGRVSIDGPGLGLDSQQALGLSLTIHELATNAAKYGALSSEAGRVAVSWTGSEGAFNFDWIETGGPPVTVPVRRGFGSTLIERLISSYFRGEGRIDFQPSGIVFSLRGKVARPKD